MLLKLAVCVKRHRITLPIVVLLAVASVAVGTAAEPKPILPSDFHSLTWVGDPRWSPVDDRIVFTASQSNKDCDGYDMNVWMIRADGSDLRQLTCHPKADFAPRWSADGSEILFVSTRNDIPQAWVLPCAGGEAHCITPFELGVSQAEWIPGSPAVSFVAKVPPDWKAGRKKPEELKKPENKELKMGVRVIRNAIYRTSASYFEGLRPHLFTRDIETGEVRQLTAGEVSAQAYSWSSDGRQVVVQLGHIGDATDFGKNRLTILNRDGSKARTLNEEPRLLTGAWRPRSPEIMVQEWFYCGFNPKHFMVDANTGEWRTIDTGYDGAHGFWRWSRDGQHLFGLTEEKGEVHVWSFDPESGKGTRITSGPRQIGLHSQMFATPGLSLSPDGSRFVAAQTTSDCPEELVVGSTADGTTTPLTDLNREWRKTHDIVPAEKFTFETNDGHAIEAWIIPPACLEKGKQYPLVLEIHGGPETMYGEHFMIEFQVLAGAGFGVLYINPRGSTGYGEASTRSVHDNWSDTPYGDLMAGVDAAIARYDWIDRDRLGVAGGSYGGFMTAWIISHTTRFKAAVPMRGVYNQCSFSLTTDILQYTQDEYGPVWADPEKYWRFSPLAYADKIKTPCLIIHSENDFRAPITDAEQLFAALKLHDVPAEFVRYREEGHELSRSGRPDRRVDRLERIVAWFKRWL